MIEKLDRFWETRIRARSARFAAADATDDQTQWNHALITILGFGGFAIALSAMGILAVAVFTGLWLEQLRWTFTAPLAIGIVAGVAFYVYRELQARIEDWHYKPWDGIGDVLKPIAWPGAWALAALFGDVPWWTGLFLYLSAGAVAAHSFLFRPVPKAGT